MHSGFACAIINNITSKTNDFSKILLLSRDGATSITSLKKRRVVSTQNLQSDTSRGRDSALLGARTILYNLLLSRDGAVW